MLEILSANLNSFRPQQLLIFHFPAFQYNRRFAKLNPTNKYPKTSVDFMKS